MKSCIPAMALSVALWIAMIGIGKWLYSIGWAGPVLALIVGVVLLATAWQAGKDNPSW